MAERPKRSRKKILLLIALAVVILLGAAGAIASRRREKPILITTEKAFRTNITQTVTATGKIQPEVEVKIAPEVSGEIIEIAVKEGQIVQRGQLLMRIKPDSYRAQVEAQQAALNGARAASVRNRAELQKAETDYQRIQKLYESGLISEAERNAAKTAYDGARAALDSAISGIQQAEAPCGRSTRRSPRPSSIRPCRARSAR